MELLRLVAEECGLSENATVWIMAVLGAAGWLHPVLLKAIKGAMYAVSYPFLPPAPLSKVAREFEMALDDDEAIVQGNELLVNNVTFTFNAPKSIKKGITLIDALVGPTSCFEHFSEYDIKSLTEKAHKVICNYLDKTRRESEDNVARLACYVRGGMTVVKK